MRRTFAHPRPGSVTSWLIFLSVLVYVVDGMLLKWGQGYPRATPAGPVVFPPLYYWGHFSKMLAIDHFQIWRFITFQFLHGGFDHLVFNMLTLYFFGPMIEAYLMSRLYVVFYLLSGIGGASLYLALLVTDKVIAYNWTPLVGASAGIFGILIASARIAPSAIALVFGFFPMRLRTLIWIFIGYAILQIWIGAANAGGEAAHLGGAAVGYLLIRRPQVLERIAWFGKRAPPF
jgi:membrane associated rhomboid family serine protease